eukprot:6542370-Prymnesium_polylepis.2
MVLVGLGPGEGASLMRPPCCRLTAKSHVHGRAEPGEPVFAICSAAEQAKPGEQSLSRCARLHGRCGSAEPREAADSPGSAWLWGRAEPGHRLPWEVLSDVGAHVAKSLGSGTGLAACPKNVHLSSLVCVGDATSHNRSA